MKQRKLNRRKGFTLVELLVVIAILAILATVSVVGYTSFTKKAKVSNDVSLTTQMNTILQANEVTDGTNATPHEAVEELVEGGLDVTKLTPTANGYSYVYDLDANRMVLVDENMNVISPESKEFTNKLNVFAFVGKEADLKESKYEGYSFYLKNNFESDDDVEVTTGVDTGNNKISKLTYKNTTSTAQKVVVRTNGGELVVNAANDDVAHYGKSTNINVEAVKENSFHENGNVTGTVTIKKGHFVVESSAKVNEVVVPSTATGTVKVTNKGTLSIIDTEKAPTSSNVSVENNGSIDVALGNTTISGNQSSKTFEASKKLTADTHEITEGGYYDGTGVELTSAKDNYALYINTTDKVVIKGLAINGNFHGILISKQGEIARDFTLIDSSITGTRALCSKGADNVSVQNCSMYYIGLADYDKQVKNMTQGFLINNDGANVEISNSKIYGFAYSTYSSAASNVTLTLNNCDLKGRAGVATYDTNGLKANINNCKIHGINGFEGTTETFANITTQNLSDGNKNVEFSVSDCEFTVYRLPATTNNYQYAVSVDYENTKLNLSGNNTFYGEICYAEALTKDELSNKAYSIIHDVRTGKVNNTGFTSIEMVLTSSDGNSVSIKSK